MLHLDETRNTTLSGRIIADDHTFIDCQFRNAEVVFTGGTAPAFIRCDFDATRLLFEGPADNTLQYLRALAGAGPDFKVVVASLLPELVGVSVAPASAAND